MGHLTAVFFSLVAVLSPLSATAQEGPFPSRPITILSPYGAGSPTDTVVRMMGDNISARTGQPMLLEARPGAFGAIAVTAVARAKPDGYTLMYAADSAITQLPFTTSDLQVDTGKDLAPITIFARTGGVLVVATNSPIKTMAAMIAAAKARPGTITYGVYGTSTRLISARLDAEAGAKFSEIPYKGQSDSQTALLGGHIQMALLAAGSAKQLVDSGQGIALATTTPKRHPLLPDVPAVAELLPGYERVSWLGILTTGGTPVDRVNRLNREFQAAMQEQSVRAGLTKMGFEVVGSSVEEFAGTIRSDLKLNGELIRKYNITN
jgi:tripartite-type tricarboxylate transporter receptor subunit TctC